MTSEGVTGEGGDEGSDKMEEEGVSPIKEAGKSPTADNDGERERG